MCILNVSSKFREISRNIDQPCRPWTIQNFALAKATDLILSETESSHKIDDLVPTSRHLNWDFSIKTIEKLGPKSQILLALLATLFAPPTETCGRAVNRQPKFPRERLVETAPRHSMPLKSLSRDSRQLVRNMQTPSEHIRKILKVLHYICFF